MLNAKIMEKLLYVSVIENVNWKCCVRHWMSMEDFLFLYECTYYCLFLVPVIQEGKNTLCTNGPAASKLVEHNFRKCRIIYTYKFCI
jgi:hypothetical protein